MKTREVTPFSFFFNIHTTHEGIVQKILTGYSVYTELGTVTITEEVSAVFYNLKICSFNICYDVIKFVNRDKFVAAVFFKDCLHSYPVTPFLHMEIAERVFLTLPVKKGTFHEYAAYLHFSPKLVYIDKVTIRLWAIITLHSFRNRSFIVADINIHFRPRHIYHSPFISFGFV